MELTTTGISGLDAQLGGGVPRGSTILLFAEPGNALSLFSEQFAAGGIGSAENAYYYEFDRPITGIRPSVEALATNKAPYRGYLQINDGYSTQFGKGSIPEGEDDLVALINREDGIASVLGAVQASPEGQAYRVVLESLSTMMSPGDEDAVEDFMKRLTNLGYELGGVHLVGVVKGIHDPVFEQRLKHLATGVMELGMERKGFGIYPYLLISKMLNMKDPVRLLLYKETDKGLWLESTKRVF